MRDSVSKRSVFHSSFLFFCIWWSPSHPSRLALSLILAVSKPLSIQVPCYCSFHPPPVQEVLKYQKPGMPRAPTYDLEPQRTASIFCNSVQLHRQRPWSAQRTPSAPLLHTAPKYSKLPHYLGTTSTSFLPTTTSTTSSSPFSFFRLNLPTCIPPYLMIRPGGFGISGRGLCMREYIAQSMFFSPSALVCLLLCTILLFITPSPNSCGILPIWCGPISFLLAVAVQ